MKQYRNQVQKEAYPRIRIAVLDTGYNPNTEFFLDRDRQRRLRGWKDWAVESSAYPRDDNGHGSNVLSLLMKMAPMADMYVARIAKNSAQLERSSQSIADVKFFDPYLPITFILTTFRPLPGRQTNAKWILFACLLVLPRKKKLMVNCH